MRCTADHSRSSRRVAGRAIAAAAAATLTLLAGVGPVLRSASAHIEAEAVGAVSGGYALVHIHVPSERANTSTVRVEIEMPTDVDIPYVWVRPPAGWTASVAKRQLSEPIRTERGDITEVVATVTFEGGSIAADQFETFDIRLGPLPAAEGTVLAFRSVQTYSDGTVERWDEPVESGEPEPDHPVPTVVVRDDEDDDDEESEDDHGVTTLGVIGVVLGAAGVGLGAVALATRRGRTRTGP